MLLPIIIFLSAVAFLILIAPKFDAIGVFVEKMIKRVIGKK